MTISSVITCTSDAMHLASHRDIQQILPMHNALATQPWLTFFPRTPAFWNDSTFLSDLPTLPTRQKDFIGTLMDVGREHADYHRITTTITSATTSAKDSRYSGASHGGCQLELSVGITSKQVSC